MRSRVLQELTMDLAIAIRPAVQIALPEVGRPGSRALIPTPAAVLDLDAFERNLARMADRARAAGLALRPHAKSHKCADIAKRQIAAGAVGICCAKLGEAEALAVTGIDDILLTSPVAGEMAARRVARLAADTKNLRVVVDHPEGAAELAAAAHTPISVLIDVDVGLGRTGVSGPEQALEIARLIQVSRPLRLLGVQGYGGHWQHIEGANARAAAVAEGMTRLSGVIDALRQAGFPVDVVTGGGTGTFEADAAQGVLNEVQPGSYPFMDTQYRDALKEDPDGAFEQSLFIATSVISANHPMWVTVDGGLKAFSTDGPTPLPATSKFAGCGFAYFGDEHGLLMRPTGQPVARGERVEFVPGHIDPTLDRYDVIHLVRNDVLVDIVPVEARGAAQ